MDQSTISYKNYFFEKQSNLKHKFHFSTLATYICGFNSYVNLRGLKVLIHFFPVKNDYEMLFYIYAL